MKTPAYLSLVLGLLPCSIAHAAAAAAPAPAVPEGPSFAIQTSSGQVRIDGFYFETSAGRIPVTPGRPDNRDVSITYQPDGQNRQRLRLAANPSDGITKWGFTVESAQGEYYTGLMERVVDGPQGNSWRVGMPQAMDLRGQRVEMIVKPTTSVYAPYFMSSRGYAMLTQSDWPGVYDFAAANPARVNVEFEGPELTIRIYTGSPLDLVKMHALDAGPPILPPKWMYRPWRWRDEHRNLANYYDGTPVTAPFNSQALEDILMMKAYGIPTGVYWIDRPWAPGALGYDDFEIDDRRLPNYGTMVKWLESQNIKSVLWIGPFFQGKMRTEALEKGYTLAGQPATTSLTANNYPMVDMSNPAAKAYWQAGVEKLLKLGVAGFKLDRGEENIPENGPFKRFDGKSIRENRNTYVALYAQAVAEIARKVRGNDFLAMPRGSYTGSSSSAVFWGGDVAGTAWGLRASIVAVQRSAVMGYPNWGSDTGGYNMQTMDQDMYMRWLGFSAFTPIMEVGPTLNRAFWDLPRTGGQPTYDEPVIAAWRVYARLHERLVEYSYAQGVEANKSGVPIVRPLFLVEPGAKAAWDNWWTYQYGPDLVVSPVWEKGKRDQQVYLPAGARWRDAWQTDKVYDGGQTITVKADLHQIPIFVRNGAAVARVLGDLNREWTESLAIAAKRPDLKALDAEIKRQFPTLTLSVPPPYPPPAAPRATPPNRGAAPPPQAGGATPGPGPATETAPAPRGQ